MRIEHRFECEFIPRKDGTPGQRMRYVPIEFCALNRCDLCGLLAGVRRVTERNDCYGWNRIDHEDMADSRHTLCVGCWNTVKPIVALQRISYEIGRLSRKLERESKAYGKQVRQTSRQPHSVHRAGEVGRSFAREGVSDIEARGSGECVT